MQDKINSIQKGTLVSVSACELGVIIAVPFYDVEVNPLLVKVSLFCGDLIQVIYFIYL